MGPPHSAISSSSVTLLLTQQWNQKNHTGNKKENASNQHKNIFENHNHGMSVYHEDTMF